MDVHRALGPSLPSCCPDFRGAWPCSLMCGAAHHLLSAPPGLRLACGLQLGPWSQPGPGVLHHHLEGRVGTDCLRSTGSGHGPRPPAHCPGDLELPCVITGVLTSGRRGSVIGAQPKLLAVQVKQEKSRTRLCCPAAGELPTHTWFHRVRLVQHRGPGDSDDQHVQMSVGVGHSSCWRWILHVPSYPGPRGPSRSPVCWVLQNPL